MLTIFTPSFNRAHTLPRLHESLKGQTDKNFEWIIINDGSTDNTDDIVKQFIRVGAVDIVYRATRNGGKMRAVNQAVKLARGEFFFIVDSDDYVTSDCVEKISRAVEQVPDHIGALVFRRYDLEPHAENRCFARYTFDASPVEAYFIDKIADRAEVIRTRLLAENPFPEIEGEKFVPEGYVWNKIGNSNKFRYIDEPIYLFEYLDDGYTRNFSKLLKDNPIGCGLYYRSMLSYNIPIFYKMKFLVRLIQCWCYQIARHKNVGMPGEGLRRQGDHCRP